MNKKDFSGAIAILSTIAQALFYGLDNITMVYLLTIPLCVSALYNFEEQFKERYNKKKIKQVSKN